MGGFQSGDMSGMQTMPVTPPGGGKPGGQSGGGMGTKPGGTVASPDISMMQGGNPAWSPNSAQTLLQQNANEVAPGSHPLNPVPSWYTGSQQFRGANHPDPLIGRGRMQTGFHSMRNIVPHHTNTQMTPPPGSAAAPNNSVAS
jgi:hypothetical protein